MNRYVVRSCRVTRRVKVCNTGRHSDQGSSLILALVFLIVGSLVVATLAGSTISNLHNTAAFSSSEATLYSANGAAERAIGSVRYTYLTGSVTEPCPGADPVTINGISMSVFCSQTTNVGFSRRVSLSVYADPSGSVLGFPPSSQALLTAVVGFVDDTQSVPGPYSCTTPPSSNCGVEMFIQSWNVLH